MSKPIFFTASAEDFKKIPGSPVAYWVSDAVREIFSIGTPIGDIASPRKGNTTTDNNRFLRAWHEVQSEKAAYGYTSGHKIIFDQKKWVPYNKGGGYRKWYGFCEFLINWFNNGEEIKNIPHSVIANEQFFFKSGLTWSTVTSKNFSIRKFGNGFIFDNGGCCVFGNEVNLMNLILFMNSSVFKKLFAEINPTLNFQSGEVAKVPFINIPNHKLNRLEQVLVKIGTTDWDSYETSWDFKSLPFLRPEHCSDSLEEAYARTRADWQEMTDEMKELEEENNRIFIDAYGLQDELTPDVPLKEITLTCNPFYRYGEDGENATEEKKAELEARLKADSVKELLSYAIGCMMGRYSLDEEGLIYASAGNEGFDASRYASFPADDDGIIPLTDEAWFEDDAASRFREFCKAVWGEESLEQNMQFVADQLDPKAGEAPDATIRRWLSTKFFKDWHLKTYKKRPIYWLFSSGKQKAFECLVYLHRYNENTLPRMRASYVTPLQSKIASRLELLEHQIGSATSTASRNALKKQRDSLIKKQDELRRFDDLLRHYADQRIALDLDDGVKVNYAKLGELLAETKAITGGKED